MVNSHNPKNQVTFYSTLTTLKKQHQMDSAFSVIGVKMTLSVRSRTYQPEAFEPSGPGLGLGSKDSFCFVYFLFSFHPLERTSDSVIQVPYIRQKGPG